MHHISGRINNLQDVLNKHTAVLSAQLEKFKGVKAKMYIKKDVWLVFGKARLVSNALHKSVEQELERLQEQGIITSVPISDWAAPIVRIVKPDGNIRICGEYKFTINKVSETTTHPLAQIDDIFTSSGGWVFSKLDLSHTYQQLELEEDSQVLTTANATKGLFKYILLPFGISSAHANFQKWWKVCYRGWMEFVSTLMIFWCQDHQKKRSYESWMKSSTDSKKLEYIWRRRNEDSGCLKWSV